MKITELTRSQLIEVKGHYLSDKLMEEEHRGISYGELADVDSLVSDDEIFKVYAEYTFTPDDFFD